MAISLSGSMEITVCLLLDFSHFWLEDYKMAITKAEFRSNGLTLN